MKRTAAAMALMALLAGCGHSSQTNLRSDQVSALVKGSQVAASLATSAGFPFSNSLAMQLQLSDPRVHYEVLTSPTQVPTGSAIGVYSTPTVLWLNQRTPGGLLLTLRRVLKGPAHGSYGPNLAVPSPLIDGDFATPLRQSWSVEVGAVAQATRDPSIRNRGSASLRINGTGQAGTPTLVYQALQTRTSLAAGTVYTLDLAARTSRLSRPLYVYVKLVYRRRGYQFFVVTPRTASSLGIPAGSTKGWISLEGRAVARRPVSEVLVYAIDTGSRPLTGSAWITDVTLAAPQR